MQFKFLFLTLIGIISVYVTSRKSKRSKLKKSRLLSNTTDIDLPKVNITAIPVKKCKKKIPVSNIYSHIILSRLYAYENKLYPFMMNMDILPKSDDRNAIKNSQIMVELDRAIGHEMEKSDAKALLGVFDKTLKDFLNELKSKGSFKVEGNNFSYKLNNPKKQPESPIDDCKKENKTQNNSTNNKTIPNKNNTNNTGPNGNANTTNNTSANGNLNNTNNFGQNKNNNNSTLNNNSIPNNSNPIQNNTAGTNPDSLNNSTQGNNPSVNTPGTPPPIPSNSTLPINNSTNNETETPLTNATYSSGPNLWGKIKSTVNSLSNVADTLLGQNKNI